MNYIDTHCHLDGEEFNADRDAVVQRARDAGCAAIFLPAIDLASCHTVLDTCRQYPGYCYPMLGLHPEEVRADWRDQLAEIKKCLNISLTTNQPPIPSGGVGGGLFPIPSGGVGGGLLAIGEVGLDFYWSREFEQEQLLAFEEQVRWSVELQLPLMIHCRKAQNEMVAILKKYKDQLPGGVFHCFTGNTTEARQLLDFDRFVLGIGGVLTFKKSNLPATLASTADGVPLERLVLETDAPYMAPVPLRGQRNEPAFIRHVITRLAEAYGVSEDDICQHTNANVRRVFAL
jgi:TatD DNase family protein